MTLDVMAISSNVSNQMKHSTLNNKWSYAENKAPTAITKIVAKNPHYAQLNGLWQLRSPAFYCTKIDLLLLNEYNNFDVLQSLGNK